MKTQFNWIKMFGIGAVVFATTTMPAAAQVTASLDPQSIALGDSAQLTITISGSDNPQPEIPTVGGLEFTPVGQSSSFQSINGTVTASVSLTYQVTPDRAGTFTIPGISLPGGGSSQPVTLQVLNSAGGVAASPPSSLPPPTVQSGLAVDRANVSGEPAFLQVVMPRQKLYVGELVPVQVKAYFRAGMAASLSGLPVLSSDAFTLNKLDDKPGQTQEMVGDHPYTVLTWTSALTAVKAGDYTANLELPVVVSVQERGRRGSNPFKQFFGNGNSPFDNSFFDNSAFDDFFGGVTQKPLTLRASLNDVNVLPLPVAGKPADFSGAVGKFVVSSEAAPTQLTAGDPITLRLKINGAGNFDRVYSHGLDASAKWKAYPPSASFEPSDTAGYGGTKTFEQAIVPLAAGKENIPALAFSYFDPDVGQYVTRSTTPIPIDVSPDGISAAVPAPPAGSATTVPSPSINPSGSELAPNQVEAGNFVSSLRPVVLAPWFVAIQGLPVMALVATLLIHRRQQRLTRDPERVRSRSTQAAVRERLVTMERALAANNSPEFFAAARSAAQEKLAQRWHLSPGEVTSAEIKHRLNGGATELRSLFAVADDVVYSGRRLTSSELRHWRETVLNQLKQMEEL